MLPVGRLLVGGQQGHAHGVAGLVQQAGQSQAVAAVVAGAAEQQRIGGHAAVAVLAVKPEQQGLGGALHELGRSEVLLAHSGLVKLAGLGGGKNFHGSNAGFSPPDTEWQAYF